MESQARIDIGDLVEVPIRIVDCDVHPAVRSPEELIQYMSEPWRSRESKRRAYGGSQPGFIYPLAGADGVRLDANPPGGGPAASDPEFTRQQLFNESGVDIAILIPLLARPKADSEHEAAGCAAVNNWLADVWLDKPNWDGRFRGTLSVCMSDPDLAVKELDRWAGHPYFVQVLLRPTTPTPLGQAQFHKIYAAAERNGLVIALHPLRVPGMGLMTPVGFPSYYLELHPALALYQTAHLTSMIFEGIFERFPRLRVACVEGGVSWFAPYIWRLDKHWKALRSEVPWLKRMPSEYFREHVRLTTQPWEEPPQASDLSVILEWLDIGNTLMFATDYPHHDADDPKWMIPHLPAEYRDRILAKTAIETYNLALTRAAHVNEKHG
jgi:uncharacterized protein